MAIKRATGARCGARASCPCAGIVRERGHRACRSPEGPRVDILIYCARRPAGSKPVPRGQGTPSHPTIPQDSPPSGTPLGPLVRRGRKDRVQKRCGDRRPFRVSERQLRVHPPRAVVIIAGRGDAEQLTRCVGRPSAAITWIAANRLLGRRPLRHLGRASVDRHLRLQLADPLARRDQLRLLGRCQPKKDSQQILRKWGWGRCQATAFVSVTV